MRIEEGNIHMKYVITGNVIQQIVFYYQQQKIDS